jgi:LysM repeat protein
LAAAVAASVLLRADPVSAEATPPCEGKIMVEPGETLSRIAQRCGLTLSMLLRENPQIDNPNLVSVGTVLDMPDPQIAREAMRREVEAQPGDTLATIADRHSIPLAVLISANPEIHPEELASGTVVGLPDDG